MRDECAHLDPMDYNKMAHHIQFHKDDYDSKGFVILKDINRHKRKYPDLQLFRRSVLAKLEREGVHPTPKDFTRLIE